MKQRKGRKETEASPGFWPGPWGMPLSEMEADLRETVLGQDEVEMPGAMSEDIQVEMS